MSDMTGFELHSRKDIQSALSNRRHEQVTVNMIDRTRNSKIYNKRKAEVNQVYLSSNQPKGNGAVTSKSVGKPFHKGIYTQERSLEKHQNRDLLMKTEAKGFYIEAGEDRMAFKDHSKKSTEIGSVGSNQQLPFLMYSQLPSGDDTFRRTGGVATKQKSKVFVQKHKFNIKQTHK